ncbi:metallophosphoesterase family protein [Janthinobacterium sp.]|uniref:metallophosphoesterase family protein n=1 Tax=Janthinobacterium sp. TaxID=1871054 RepID=UPI00293D4CAE|nr:metallophosphoesterase family protein [Janthinobacterium sp.]
MRLLILSDLHNEQWREHAPRIDPSAGRPDAVILAGDIDTGAAAVEWAARTFAGLPVLYVHGNHEGYDLDLEEAQRELRAACARAGHVHLLDCGEHVIGAVRFLGATLWTDFRLFGEEERPAAMLAAEEQLADYKRIGLAAQGSRRLRATDTAGLHAEHAAWLRRKLAEPFEGRTVVVTHMAPAYRSVPPEYAHAPTSAAFASNLDELARHSDVWVHGHMHSSSDYRLGRCRVVCNPRGYMRRSGAAENAAFDANFIVEI